MEKKMLLIYNPVSGKTTVKTHLSDIINIYTKNGYIVTVHPTQKEKDCYEYISQNARGYDVISVCGGDGTLNETVSALMRFKSSDRPPIAYMPCGSTNDFAGTIGLPTNLKGAAKMIIKGTPFFCDAGQFNDKYFAYVAAFGAFTSVAYDTAQEFKNVFGHLAYIMEGIRLLPTIKTHHMRVTFGSDVIEDDFLFGMVTNSLQVGGIKNAISTAVSLNDGLFEVLLVKKPPNPIAFNAMLGDFFTNAINADEIIRFKASEIKFECDDNDLSWTLDGEYGGTVKTACIKNLPRAYSVIV